MIEHPDPAVAEAIRAAIKSPVKKMYDIVLFDWDRDGTWDHEYTDLSALVSGLQLDQASLSTDLPEDVNILQGHGSAKLTFSLSGARRSEEMPVLKLLSQWTVGGPFQGQRLTGVPVRYMKGYSSTPETTQQFFGWIREIKFDVDEGSVSIECTNTDPWTSSAVTLPSWAVTDRVYSYYPGDGNRPINAQWAVTEALAAAGTEVGPRPREDAVAYVSGNGGFIPRIGTMTRNFTDVAPHGLDTSPVDLWEQGPFGITAARTAQGSGLLETNTVRGFTSETVFTPNNGIDSSPRNVGISFWSYSNGQTDNNAEMTYCSVARLYLSRFEMVSDSYYNVEVQVWQDGRAFVVVLGDSPTAGQPNTVEWVWEFNTLGQQGWRYFDFNFRFTSTGLTMVHTLSDGVNRVIRTPASSSGSGPFRLILAPRAGVPPWPGPNLNNRFIFFSNGKANHFQIYYGDSSAVYRPGQENPPTNGIGVPWANDTVGPCMAELSWIPHTTSVTVWELLQTLALSEHAVMFINEWGQVVFQPHVYAREYETPPVATVEVEDILSMVVNPSLDFYRNSVEIPYTDRKLVRDDVVTFESGQVHPTPRAGGVIGSGVTATWAHPLEDGIVTADYDTIYFEPEEFWHQPAGDPPIEGAIYLSETPGSLLKWASCSARYRRTDGSVGGYVQVGSDDYWDLVVWSYLSDDGKTLNVYTYLPVNSSATDNGIYVGAGELSQGVPNSGVPGDALSWLRVPGLKYDEEYTRVYALDDDAQVAEVGRRTLALEPNEWRQTPATAEALAPLLLTDVLEAPPVIEGLQIDTDPRLQILDFLQIESREPFTAPVLAQIVGIRRDSDAGVDEVDVRIIRTVQAADVWQLGISQLGVNTILS